MSQFGNTYQDAYGPTAVYDAPATDRATFIRKTYLHLAGAVLAFAGIEAILLLTMQPLAAAVTATLLSSPIMWLVVLGVFMAVSWVARSWAESNASIQLQYAGLGLYVVAEAIIFLPILFIAHNAFDGVIMQAAVITLATFAGLTVFAFISGVDFSFLRGALVIGGMIAMVAVVASLFMGGFNFGLVASSLVALLACGYILFDTSNVLRHYQTTQHVAASLALFASLALLFWYILRIAMILANRD